MLSQWVPQSQSELASASAGLVDDIVLHGLVGMSSAGPVYGRMSQAEQAWRWGISRQAHSSRSLGRRYGGGGEGEQPGEGDFSMGESSGGEGAGEQFDGSGESESEEERDEAREAEMVQESVAAGNGLGFSSMGYERGSALRDLSAFFDSIPDTSRPWLQPDCLGDY